MTATAPVADPRELFEAHQHLAFQTVLRLRSRHRQCTVDELENAALYGVWKAAQTWDKQTQFRTWAIKLARWAVWDYTVRTRDGGRNQTGWTIPRLYSLDRYPWHGVDDGAERVREIVEAHDCCAVVLARLPPRRAAILRRRFLDCCTLEEIAQEQGVSVTAVGHQIATALKRARSWCSGCA